MQPKGLRNGPLDRWEKILMSEPDPDNNDTRGAEWIGIGIALGLSFGASLGLLLDNLAIGIGMGMALGVTFGAAMMASKRGGGAD